MKKKIIFPLLVLLLILCACAEDKSFFKDGALANQETTAADLEAEKRWEELEEFLEMIVQEEIKPRNSIFMEANPDTKKFPQPIWDTFRSIRTRIWESLRKSFR